MLYWFTKSILIKYLHSVRFLDNFSAGTRGSASAEHFLRTGKYAVIFLHRQHSLQPFSRHYSHSTNPFLDLLEVVGSESEDLKGKGPGFEDIDLEGMLFPPVPAAASHSTSAPTSPTFSSSTSSSQRIQIPPPHLNPMLSLLKSYRLVKSLGILHSISFTTVDEYLYLLRGVSSVMGTAKDSSRNGKALGRRGMFYLAAAVSDFFIPTQRMVSFPFNVARI